MSLICGVFGTGGAAVDREQLSRMCAAAPLLRAGAVHTWAHGGSGLAWRGEAVRIEERDDVVIVADARLHDRDALREPLGLSAEDMATEDEISLIRRAYLKWGSGFPAHLIGDFAIAVLDRRRGRLLLTRDPFGARPLCLYRHDKLLVFGSWMQSVLAYPEVPRRINEARVADYFVDRLESLDVTSTFYEGIERLPPAHVLTVEDGSTSCTRYWRLSLDRSRRGASAEEQVAALRDTLSKAIDGRLGAVPGTGLMLSGGIDSISVACLAREVRQSRGEGDLPVLCGVLPDSGACTEGPYARAVIDGGGLAPTWVHPEEVARCGGVIRHIVDTTEDLFDVAMLELRVALYAEAARQGLPALLDGVDGNLVFSHDVEALGFLLRRGRLGAAWAVAGGLSRFYRTSRLGLLLKEGLIPLRPAALARAWRRLRPAEPPAHLLRETLVAPGLADRTDLLGRLQLRFHVDSETLEAIRRDPRTYHRRNLESPMIPVALERYARAAAYQGLEATHPILDRRVAEAALALSLTVKIEGGWPKSVLRRAVAPLAPTEVVWRLPAHNLSTQFWAVTLAEVGDLLADLEGRRFKGIAEFADMKKTDEALRRWRVQGCVVSGVRAFRVAALASWLHRAG